jgi:hypothetical protein
MLEFDCKQTITLPKKKERILGSTLLLEARHRSLIESMPSRMQKALAVLGFVTPHQRCHSWKRTFSEADFVIHALHKYTSAV